MSAIRSFSSLSMSSMPPRPSRGGSSVYGGAGGRNVQVSYASNHRLGSGFDLASALGDGGSSFSVSGGEKHTMKNLNDRLATYLDKVRRLESANAELEHKIQGWYERQTPTTRDYSKYEAVVADLRKGISAGVQDNARLMLQIDNARLAAEDFRIKFENELAVRMSVEGDIGGLRKVLDEMTMTRSGLEMEVEGLREELVYLRKTHEEELAALRSQTAANKVNVEMDTKPQDDMASVLNTIRSQYEGITEKNRREMESWYNGKFDELNKQVAHSEESIESSKSEISDLKRTLQALQIELHSQLSLKSALEGQLAETESRYNMQMKQLQAIVNNLESELSHMRADIERQAADYQMLLDIKTRLELEISEYRRLLDGEMAPSKTVITKTQVSSPKPKPVVTQRRRVVIEEIVDGRVVSRTEDLDSELIK